MSIHSNNRFYNLKADMYKDHSKNQYWQHAFLGAVRLLSPMDEAALITRLLLEKSITGDKAISHHVLVDLVKTYAAPLGVKERGEGGDTNALSNLINADVVSVISIDDVAHYQLSAPWLDFYKKNTGAGIEIPFPPHPNGGASTFLFDYWSVDFIKTVFEAPLTSPSSIMIRSLIQTGRSGGVTFQSRSTKPLSFRYGDAVTEELKRAGTIYSTDSQHGTIWHITDSYASLITSLLSKYQIKVTNTPDEAPEPHHHAKLVSEDDFKKRPVFYFSPELQFTYDEMKLIDETGGDIGMEHPLVKRILTTCPDVSSADIRAFARKVVSSFSTNDVAKTDMGGSAISAYQKEFQELPDVAMLDPYIASLMEDLQRTTSRLKDHLIK